MLEFKLIVVKCQKYYMLKGINHKLCITDYNIFHKLITGPAGTPKKSSAPGYFPRSALTLSGSVGCWCNIYIRCLKNNIKMIKCCYSFFKYRKGNLFFIFQSENNNSKQGSRYIGYHSEMGIPVIRIDNFLASRIQGYISTTSVCLCKYKML